MCHIWEVHVQQVLKTLVCAQVFMSGVTISLQSVILEYGQPGIDLNFVGFWQLLSSLHVNVMRTWESCSVIMYGVGHVDGIVAVFPAFGSLEKSCWKRKHIWQTSSSSGTGTMDKLEVFFLPYLVQEFLEVSTSLHIRFLSRSPCITS